MATSFSFYILNFLHLNVKLTNATLFFFTLFSSCFSVPAGRLPSVVERSSAFFRKTLILLRFRAQPGVKSNSLRVAVK